MLASKLSFNPLRIGSYCNYEAYNAMDDFNMEVSIPLESGHIVILP